MAKRKIKDAKDISSGELIYFKGHAKATFMSNGETVEDGKQDKLISGTNIKTINGTSLLGEGDIVINGGGESEDIYTLVVDEESMITGSGSVSAEEFEKICKSKILSLQMSSGDEELSVVVDFIFAQTTFKLDSSGSLMVGFSSISQDFFSSEKLIVEQTLIFYGNSDGNAIWELQTSPLFKTINGESILGDGDISVSGSALNLGSGLQYGASGNLNLQLGNGLCFSGDDKSDLNVKLLDESTINEPEKFIPVSYGYGISRDSGLGVLLSDDFTISTDDGHFRLGLGNAISSHGYEEITLGSNVKSTTIDPNIYYVWNDKMSNLTISLGPSVSGVTNEFSFQFTSGSTPTVLTLPSNIKWLDGKSPEIEANCTYQVSILNNLGVCVKFY